MILQYFDLLNKSIRKGGFEELTSLGTQCCNSVRDSVKFPIQKDRMNKVCS